jgi:hypothetical protein
MSCEAQKYRDYARECLRQSKKAQTAERRNKLVDLARVWANAAAVLDADEATTKESLHGH